MPLLLGRSPAPAALVAARRTTGEKGDDVLSAMLAAAAAEGLTLSDKQARPNLRDCGTKEVTLQCTAPSVTSRRARTRAQCQAGAHARCQCEAGAHAPSL